VWINNEVGGRGKALWRWLTPNDLEKKAKQKKMIL